MKLHTLPHYLHNNRRDNITYALIGTQSEWQALHDANRINEKTVSAIANQKILPEKLLALTDDAYNAQYPSRDQVSAAQVARTGFVAAHTKTTHVDPTTCPAEVSGNTFTAEIHHRQ